MVRVPQKAVAQKTRRPKIKPTKHLTLRDRLSRLTFYRATQLLGPDGKQFMQQGNRYDMLDAERDVYMRGDLFRLKFPIQHGRKPPVVTITSMAEHRDRLNFNCNVCETMCEHIGATVSFILENKTVLGLAAAPDEKRPIELMSEKELLEHALFERMERARTEKFRVQSSNKVKPWTDYTVVSLLSGKTYRVALRGEQRGQSYCSCPDFRTNTLGTCKHIMHVLNRVKRIFAQSDRRRPYRNKEAFVHVLYGDEVTLHLRLPDKADPEMVSLAGKAAEGPVEHVRKLVDLISAMEHRGWTVNVYPDAEELIQRRLHQERMTGRMVEIHSQAATHPLRKELLKMELLPYQLEGIAFAVAAGRAILADDMGLGKTIQGVGTAEMLARETGIRKVLVVCPASLKSQWRNEIERFCDRSVQLVMGSAKERSEVYCNDAFFTICNYEQVLRDILAIERANWDLIILDEGQRIKNWESKTARVIKGLKSPFALVLSGTPLENRLDELHSVMQFVDDRRLPPAFRFLHRHRVVDDDGRVKGYKNLDKLREAIRPVLLRRTRDSVLQQLPPRTTELVRIPPTDEQKVLHDTNMQVVSMITRKAFISEMDLLRLQKALLMCRMAADSTFLVDKQTPSYSTKLEYLDELLEGLFVDDRCKAVLFSEWTTMLNLIEPMLKRRKLDFVRLDGSVPQKDRQMRVNRFREDPNCRLFISTNAGATGLNLQAANTVINVDLPWNPAVLEQRIARAHRMGQKNPVQVYILVTEQTLEENLLNTLSAKRDLALAALDFESEVTQVDLESGMDELRRRLEVLLGAQPHAPLDVTQKEAVQSIAAEVQAPIADSHSDGDIAQRRERVAAAGGELLGAVFNFLGELVAKDGKDSAEKPIAPPEGLVSQVRGRLDECIEDDATGRPRLTVTLPDRSALDALAHTLAKLLLNSGK